MENNIIKCSLENHKENNAVSFCTNCKIYMCNKCEKLHSELFLNHNQLRNDKIKDLSDIFTGFCSEKNHPNELNYFCKTHNKLICPVCITKIKNKEIGQHTDCNVCSVEDIEDEKRNKLKDNIKTLKELSNNLEKSIDKLKNIYNTINEKKESVKKEIQTKFTEIRNELNNREDKLLEKVDKLFEEKFINDNIIKESEKLPQKIKLSLEKGEVINNEWNNKKNKLNFLINDCLNIENNINYINKINDNIKTCNSIDCNCKFDYNDINQLLDKIKNFGDIDQNKKLFNSNIIFEQDLIKTWLDNRKFVSELLFRKSKDGTNLKDFHDKCDNKGTTITFIETSKGYIFGGYTELQWDTCEAFKKDKSTFIFSMNKKQKYMARNNNDSIYCSNSYGPVFGCDQAEIAVISLIKGQSYDDKNTNTFIPGNVLTNGEKYWDIKELEVYKIKYT